VVKATAPYRVFSKCTTLTKARRQRRLLYALGEGRTRRRSLSK
jgi:hypothetical protein